jgi:sugar lactone lactonase YvrE
LFKYPNGVAVDATGNVYIADESNHTIRKFTSGGVVTTLAGTAGSSGSTDGTGSAARFTSPTGVAVDATGNVYVADRANHSIRKITSGGVVTTLAGSTAGDTGSSDGTGSAARFYNPAGVAVDVDGTVYVAERGNHTIRKITFDGVVTTLAGTAGSSGSTDGTGSAARFYRPIGVAVDAADNVYVTDGSNHTIRKITSGGVVTTLAGTAGSSGSTDGIGSAAQFYEPAGVAVDAAGNLYVVEPFNYTIRKGSLPTPVLTTPTSASLTTTTATLGGNVTADGGISITARGVVYAVTATNATPQLDGTGVTNVTGTGTTGAAAYREVVRAVLIERESEYVADIVRRMTHERDEAGFLA